MIGFCYNINIPWFVIIQEPILFATSVMENIRYGKPDATDEDVYKAAKQANADHFIRQFPKVSWRSQLYLNFRQLKVENDFDHYNFN